MKVKIIPKPDPQPGGVELTLGLREYVMLLVLLRKGLNGYSAGENTRNKLEKIQNVWNDVFPDQPPLYDVWQDENIPGTSQVVPASIALFKRLGI